MYFIALLHVECMYVYNHMLYMEKETMTIF